MTDPTNPAPVPPRPSPDFERCLDGEMGSNITRFPRVVTTSLPEDDCSGPPFDPVRVGRDGWQVPTAIAVGILMVVTVVFFGG